MNCALDIKNWGMVRVGCLLSLMCFAAVCFAQTEDYYYGELITKTENIDNVVDTSRLFYCRNAAGDRLYVYTVRDGVLSEASGYHLTETINGLFCHRTSLMSDEQMEESLGIEFLDKSHTVVINKTDRYTLFPAYYAKFKQDVKARRSIIAFLNLLSDAIGDYPIYDVLPLVSYTPKLNKQISEARIVTQRGQADIKDTWNCKYYYNKDNLLDSTRAFSQKEIRFSKQIHYRRSGVRRIITYRNVESRQITNRSISYDMTNRSTLKWQERVFETGKNRETLLSVTLIKNDLGMLGKMKPSKAEVLKLLKRMEMNKRACADFCVNGQTYCH